MSIPEILGLEDNPFGLFLILILLLGATGYFDPPQTKAAEEGDSPEGSSSKPSIMLPVWQVRPKAAEKLVRPFSGPRPSKARDDESAKERPAFSTFLRTLSQGCPRRCSIRRPMALRLGGGKHPLLPRRHTILQ